ncbi:hypothetical protein Hanom_Chr15g01411171 [Helianthus anomalus]
MFCIPFSSINILHMRCTSRSTLNRSNWGRRSFSCIMKFIIFRRLSVVSSILKNLILSRIVNRRRSLRVNNNRSYQWRNSCIFTFK